jgi:hypothetical protein
MIEAGVVSIDCYSDGEVVYLGAWGDTQQAQFSTGREYHQNSNEPVYLDNVEEKERKEDFLIRREKEIRTELKAEHKERKKDMKMKLEREYREKGRRRR